MKDSYEQGKNLANRTGVQIFEEIGSLLLYKINSDVKEDIVRSQFINHEFVPKQAYEESFSQGNGENILKYVYDINRYFMELSLKEIKTTLNAVTHMHTLHLEELISSAIDKANKIVQTDSCQSTKLVQDHIRNAIRKEISNRDFTLFGALPMSIQDAELLEKDLKT
ncbi:unnamed protein product, partial [Didymodactylos carnosus]